MIYYKEFFGFDVQNNMAFVYCICGSKFAFPVNTLDTFQYCPICDEDYHFEKNKDVFSLIRPRTNSQLHFTQKEFDTYRGEDRCYYKRRRPRTEAEKENGKKKRRKS